jgi:amino-acid N-acetyltransferase
MTGPDSTDIRPPRSCEEPLNTQAVRFTPDPHVRPASLADVAGIVSLLADHRADPSLFLRSHGDVSTHLADFLVAQDPSGHLCGCAALHQHTADLAELLSVAVESARHSRGLGMLLVKRCLERAHHAGVRVVFLATTKPSYFARLGFRPISKWRLPWLVLLREVRRVLAQPIDRWLPAFLGRHQFMMLDLSRRTGRNYATPRGERDR